MTSLPPHPDVADALSRLDRSSLTAVALTNSTESVAEARLTNAGIRVHFDRAMSGASVGRFKPAPEPYRSVARAFDVDLADVRLVAAHSWDVSGALAAGCTAAFVARPATMLSPIGPQPDIVGVEIADVVDQIALRDMN